MYGYIGLAMLCICAVGTTALVPPPITAVMPPPTPPPLPTLTQDLDEIQRLIQFIPLKQLMARYLLNDAQFQAFVRIFNSQQAWALRMRFRSQPEVVAFFNWMNAQLMLSGGPIEIEEGEEIFSITNAMPYWSSTVWGWAGFMSEFQMYVPSALIRAHIDLKLTQNGIFTHFYTRLQALQPVYERFLIDPQTQFIIAQLQLNGIDVNQIDQIIRNIFNWIPVPATTTVAPTTTAAPTTVAPTTAAPTTAAPTTVAPTTAAPTTAAPTTAAPSTLASLPAVPVAA